jgi:hypothetical protein
MPLPLVPEKYPLVLLCVEQAARIKVAADVADERVYAMKVVRVFADLCLEELDVGVLL